MPELRPSTWPAQEGMVASACHSNSKCKVYCHFVFVYLQEWDVADRLTVGFCMFAYAHVTVIVMRTFCAAHVFSGMVRATGNAVWYYILRHAFILHNLSAGKAELPTCSSGLATSSTMFLLSSLESAATASTRSCTSCPFICGGAEGSRSDRQLTQPSSAGERERG